MTPTPILLPPPPRRVRANRGSMGVTWFGRLFILPHTLVGLGAIGYLVFQLLWITFGTDIPGVVTDTNTRQSSKGGITYLLEYQYQVGPETKSGTGSVSQEVFEHFQSQDLANPRVTVRHFSLGPLEHAELRESGGLWAGIGLLTLWATFWNAIVSVFVFELWIKPLRRRQLYKHGATAAGTLLSKRVKSGKTNSYYIAYTFPDPLSGQSINAETQVPNAVDWKGATVGQPITVLYAADNSQRSTVYEFGGYHVDLGFKVLA